MPSSESALFSRYAKALAAREVAGVADEIFQEMRKSLFHEFCRADESQWRLISAKLAVIADWQAAIQRASADAAVAKHAITTKQEERS